MRPETNLDHRRRKGLVQLRDCAYGEIKPRLSAVARDAARWLSLGFRRARGMAGGPDPPMEGRGRRGIRNTAGGRRRDLRLHTAQRRRRDHRARGIDRARAVAFELSRALFSGQACRGAWRWSEGHTAVPRRRLFTLGISGLVRRSTREAASGCGRRLRPRRLRSMERPSHRWATRISHRAPG